MKKSTVPVIYNEQTGVNLEIGEKVIFTPGKNMWGLDPEGEYEGVYVGWIRPQSGGTDIKIDYNLHIRLNPPIENVFRVWDARDDKIEALERVLWELASDEAAAARENSAWMKDTAQAGVSSGEFGSYCIYCAAQNDDYSRIIHAPDCPVVQGQSLIVGGAE